jgi:hypothetical protein
MDAMIDANLERRVQEPNEFLIQLEASAIRLTWSPEEPRRRDAYSNYWTPTDAPESIFGKPDGRQRFKSQ